MEALQRLRVFLHRLLSSPPLINLFSHLHVSVWAKKWVLHTLSYNPVLLNFVAAWVIGNYAGSRVPLAYPHCSRVVLFFFSFFEYFLTFGGTREHSRLILHVP